jgi:hypothetical protein
MMVRVESEMSAEQRSTFTTSLMHVGPFISTPMAHLPQELFDTIIDKIRDKETLKACALVATSFLLPSQRNLFRKIRLGEHSRDTFAAFAALAEFPRLVSYIRDLTIFMWDLVSENILAVAVILRSVQSIESLFVFGGFGNWGRLGDEACSVLLHFLSRPSLRRLELSNVLGIPVALILAATTIPVVSFKYVRMDLGEDISERLLASAPVPRLRHLILDDVAPAIYDFLLHPRKLAYTQQIERLEIKIAQRSASYGERIMAACAATLKYLAVNPEGTLCYVWIHGTLLNARRYHTITPSAVCPGGRDQSLGRRRQAPSGFLLPEHLTDSLLALTRGNHDPSVCRRATPPWP